MAISKSVNNKKHHHHQHHQCYISVPSEIINSLSSNSLQSLLLSPKKQASKPATFSRLKLFKNPKTWFLALFVCGFFLMMKMWYNFEPFSQNPCGITPQKDNANDIMQSHHEQGMGITLKKDSLSLVSNEVLKKDENLNEFWKQPDGFGYRPCLEFSEEYKKTSVEILKDRTKYLVVVVSGGMNQQRNQIVDAVVIARILGAALVVPILQVNVIWGDESEFGDIFDVEYFKEALADDVRIISSLPSNHLMSRPVEEKHTPLHVSPQWIRARYLKRMRREGVLLLRGLDSRLSKDLPSDLQKLRCKVAFHALRFAPPIRELGEKLTERMRRKGPYLALHLRMEKDVWVRTGCLPGLSRKYDEIIQNERKSHPELLTSRSNMTYHDRKLAGLCPLTALEVTRLLKALGVPKDGQIFWAGGNPLGGSEVLSPLVTAFPNFYSKEDLGLPGELELYAKKASIMAAIDYIVSENSDVFMASHGGNMQHAIQGHRAYAGHKKTITPNKRQMFSYFLNNSLQETEFNKIILGLHRDSMGQPEVRTSKAGRDVTKFPIPECMRNDTSY
uniref:O-fucosyltransferase 20-like n=1 Tax=Erigeron canadensis TaxID=72917 RepID=UPI001CB8A656|nr:O-fucosyltransferase 20-like [Erigeron canadensis]